MLEVLISVLISSGSVSTKQAQNLSKEQAVQIAKESGVNQEYWIWDVQEGK